MDPSQVDTLIQRLVVNPHDEQALAAAHQSGAADPKSYAMLLERVGSQTSDPAYASHWLSEAANVWSTTLGDAHRAARILMQAIERDPTQRTAADRLAQLYREKSDVKALVALLERRVKALSPLASDDAEIRAELTSIHEELGRLWNESLGQPRKGLDNFRRALELEPANRYAIYGAREVYKALGEWQNALGLFESELAVETDPARKLALLRDEAATRRAGGDLAGATRALGRARQLDAQDAGLQQEYGALIVDRLTAGENVPPQEKTLGTELLVGLAEVYDGDHGLAYSAGALDIEPGHDRALQLYAHYARSLQREEGVTSRYLAYIQANPSGPMAADARWLLAGSYESSGQLQEAIEVLEPLRTLGDPQAQAKLRELYTQSGQRMPSVAPPMALPQPSAPKVRSATGPAGRPASVGSSLAAPVAPMPVGSLEAAQILVDQGKRDEALAAYRTILEHEPNQPEALSWVEDHLRTKRDYRSLRDVLRAAVRGPGLSQEVRQERLREIAGLSEGNLRDVDGAIDAWKQLLTLDRSDEAARQALTRALEKNQRWDDLSLLLEYEASAQTDLEKKITLEKRLASLHEQKRQDFASAAESWERIVILIPDDDQAISTASALFEKAGALDRAAQVIATNASGVDDRAARNALQERLGQLRERLNDPSGAGEAYSEAAEHDRQPRLWDAAERCFVAAKQWERAGAAAVRRAEAEGDAARKAGHYARAAEHYGRGGNEAAFAENLGQATDLDPANEEFATALVELFTRSRRWDDLVGFLLKRSDRLTDRTRRVAVRREAAKVYTTEIQNKEAARETWMQVLEDGEDKEALEHVIEDAVSREDYEEATSLLRRLEDIVDDRAEKARVALREAELVADGIGDVETAIGRYERVLSQLDPASRLALQAIADLQEARDKPAAAASALEREMKLTASPADRGPIAERLARLYEQLGEPENAIRALDIVLVADPDDFDALARLCDLCEKTEEWGKLAELLAKRIEVEADNDEVVALTKKLGRVLADELDRGDEALAVFEELAQQGEAAIRDAYVELGDRLGWRGVVAAKLVEWWFEAKPSPERTTHLRGAFERFADVGRDDEAVRVGCEVIRSKGGDAAIAQHLERLSVKTNDLDSLAVAHDFLARDIAGADRARELVRQAEVQLQAGAPRAECLRHGEGGLASIAPDQAEPLLARLAVVAHDGPEIVGLYERQIGRCKSPADRVNALARAAQIASIHNEIDRARSLFDLALGTTPTEEALLVLERAAREADAQTKSNALRSALCAAMASGGQGARDGGRTRGSLLRRAASIADAELHDTEDAFDLLGEALVAHVEAASLDALEELARGAGDLRRAEATLTRALGEVFEGPMVRQLLARRARLRRDDLSDNTGAAADLKKLYDLSPTDPSALEELSQLLTLLGDHRAMVQLYEDQILRGKDVAVRAELARRVARLWEKELGDPREAADAWRRVLRMKPGDAEGAAGLEQAKANMLRKTATDTDSEAEPSPAVRESVPAKAPSLVPQAAAPDAPAEEVSEVIASAPKLTTEVAHDAPKQATEVIASAPKQTTEVAHDAPKQATEVAHDALKPLAVTAAAEAAAPFTLPSDLRDSERTAKANIVVPPMAIGNREGAEREPYEDEVADPKAITAVRTVDSLRKEQHDEAGRADDADDIDIPVDDTALADDTVIADDLAEMVESDEPIPSPPPAEKKGPAEPPPLIKRSVPPPLPRL